MVNTIEDIIKFINDKSFKKIFLLCGKKSFINSKANTLLNQFSKDKEIEFFYKSSEIPILEELVEIIKKRNRGRETRPLFPKYC